MVTLVINPGSSSKKYALYQNDQCVFSVRFEQTADGVGRCAEISGEQKRCDETSQHVYKEALHEVLTQAIDAGVISSPSAVGMVGVRVVAPGHTFAQHTVVDDTYLMALEAARSVAPLHVDPTLEELQAAKDNLPAAKLIAVSDSAFHQTVPEYRYTYSLEAARKRGIRRFGYHGLSAASITAQAAALPTTPEKFVMAHIGSGVSVIGVAKGQSVYTSMGYTPASGLVMGTRSGDIDPGALISVLESESLSGAAAHAFIQTKGGIKGLAGENDLRQILLRESRGDAEAALAMETFIERIQQSIAAAVVALGGADALILTATAMERNEELRARLLAGLAPLGIAVDPILNDKHYAMAHLISSRDSIPVWVMATDEAAAMVDICESFAK